MVFMSPAIISTSDTALALQPGPVLEAPLLSLSLSLSHTQTDTHTDTHSGKQSGAKPLKKHQENYCHEMIFIFALHSSTVDVYALTSP